VWFRRASLATTLWISVIGCALGSIGMTAALLASPYGDWVYASTLERLGLYLFLASCWVLFALAVGLGLELARFRGYLSAEVVRAFLPPS
jgi:hypothetical protein